MEHESGRGRSLGGVALEFTNELDKLRHLLDEASIPYESIKEEWDKRCSYNGNREMYGEASRYQRNQIIYGMDVAQQNSWKFDAICQNGSYGAKDGLIETYGHLGTDARGNPCVMTAEEAFEIIKEDWRKSCEKA